MSQVTFRTTDIARLLGFVVIYTAMSLILPVQGTVTLSFAIGSIITGFLYGAILWYASLYMPLSRKVRIAVIWVAVYVIQLLNPILEGLFFSTQFEGHPELALGGIIFGTILTLPTAIAAGLLFNPATEVKSYHDLTMQYFSGFTRSSFALRFIVSSILWMGIYFVFGSIVGPIVLPYYTAPGSPFHLVLPPVQVVLGLQTIRGFIYVSGVLPLILALNADKRRLAVILSALLYIGGAVAVFLISDQFAVFLRIVHGVELLADSVVAGIVISALLGRSKAEQ